MDQKLIEFALKKAGGEEQIRKEFYHAEMEQALKKTKTVGDILELAESEEAWASSVLELTRSELLELLGGTKPVEATTEKPRRSRLTPTQVAELRQKILGTLAQLGDDEALSTGEIAAKIGGVDSRTVSMQVKALREAGQVGMQGTRWSACYFLAA